LGAQRRNLVLPMSGENKTRILLLPSEYVHEGKPLDGIFCRDQAESLTQSGYRVDVIFVEPRSLRTFDLGKLRASHFQRTVGFENGIFTVRLKGWNPILNSVCGGITWAWLMRGLALWYIRQYGRPDVIHGHNIFWGGYAASLVARRACIPLVITEHSSEFVRRRVPASAVAYARGTLAAADATLAVSRSLAESITGYVKDAPLTVVPNFIDTDFFALAPAEPLRVPVIFLAVAALNRNKAVDLLIRAFAAQFGRTNKTELRIVGDGPERKALEALTRQLEVDSKVSFYGQLPREAVRRHLWEAHALVLCSYRETFGMVLVEALSSGRPVIATRCGGAEEIVNPEVGFLVDPGDCGGLGKAMALMASGARFDPIKLRQYAVSRYGRAAFAARMQSIYGAVLNPPATGLAAKEDRAHDHCY
jgi:glycosyltransferase involved in cell wall biosynthesis